MKSDNTKEKVLSQLESSMITYSLSTVNAPGFIGKVNKDQSSFWLVNQSSSYQTRSGYKYKTFRRFQGEIFQRRNETIIEGEFKIRPLFKIPIIFYLAFFIGVMIIGGIFPPNPLDKLKVIITALCMIGAGYGVIQYKLHQTRESELEMIRFIEGLFESKG